MGYRIRQHKEPNMMSADEFNEWLKVGGLVAFAALGGAMGYIMRTVDSGKKVKPLRALLEALAAGFVGLVVLFTCQAIGLSEQWTGVVVGVCGWLGANASIRLLETIVYKRLGIQREKPAEKDDDGAP